MKNLCGFFLLLSLLSCGPTLEEIEKMPDDQKGQALYEKFCTQCHGENGDLGSSGATELSKSRLSDENIVEIIKYGRIDKGMPAHKDLLGNDSNINSVKDYIKTLRK